MPPQVAVIVGVGPGLGSALVHRFAREGFVVGMMARRRAGLEPLCGEVERDGGRVLQLTGDASRRADVERAFARVREEAGEPNVLVYNASAFVPGEVQELEPSDFEEAWRAGCFGAFLCARQVIPSMRARGEGTLLFTGATASLRGSAGFAALAVPKFGLRALTQSLARELGPAGLHVAHVVIDGQINTPRVREMFPDRRDETFLSPDAIADEYWRLHTQHPTAWTLELDLRPAVERF